MADLSNRHAGLPTFPRTTTACPIDLAEAFSKDQAEACSKVEAISKVQAEACSKVEAFSKDQAEASSTDHAAILPMDL